MEQKKGFSYSALKTWNETPISNRELATLLHFKKTTENVFGELTINQTRPPGRTA